LTENCCAGLPVFDREGVVLLLCGTSSYRREERVVDCSALLELQAVDLEIDEVTHVLAGHRTRPDRLRAEVKEEATLVEKKERLFKSIQVRHRQAEKELADLNEQITTANLRLQGSGLSPNSYLAMQKEVETMRQKTSDLETKILEDMEKIEMLEKDIVKSSKIVAGRRQLLAGVEEKAGAEIAGCGRRLDELKTRRIAIALKIPGDLLEPYEDLRRKRGGRVIWNADTSSCPCCGMGIPQGVVRSLMGSTVAGRCPNCDVFLSWTGIRDGVV
jgi:uncharacterized protein